MFPAAALAVTLLAASSQLPSDKRGPALVVQSTHESHPDRMAMSPDGRLLASASEGLVKLWDVSSGLLIRDVPIPTCEWVQRLQFVGKGELLAVGGFCDKSVGSFDVAIEVATGKKRDFHVVPPYRGDQSRGGGYSEDGEKLILGTDGSEGGIQLVEWSVRKGKKLRDLPLPVQLNERTTLLSPSLVGLCLDDKWRFMNARTSQVAFPPRKGSCDFAPSVSPDGKLLAFALEGEAKTGLFDTSGKQVGTLDAGPGSQSVFSADGTRVTVLGSGEAKTFDVATQAKVGQQLIKGRLHWLVDHGEKVVEADDDYALSLFESKTGILLRRFGGRVRGVRKLAFSPDGRLLGMAHGGYRTPCSLQIWDLGTARIGWAIKGAESGRCDSIAFTPDGKQVAFTVSAWSGANPAPTKGVHLADLATGEQTVLLPNELVSRFDFSPDGKWVVLAASNTDKDPYDSTASVFERTSGAKVASFPGSGAQFSRDGKEMLVGDRLGKQEAVIVTVGTWKPVGKPFPWGDAVASPDLSLFAQGPDRMPNGYRDLSLRRRDQAGRVFGAYPGIGEQLYALVLRPDGARIATGGHTSGVLIDAKTWKPVRTLATEHPLELQAIAYSPDGEWLATGGQEGSVVLRDGLTGAPVVMLFAQEDSEGVAVLPSGEYLASKGALRAVGFRVGAHAYPFEQFDLRFNRPDAVLKALKRAPERLIEAAARARVQRLKRAGFTEEMLGDDFHLPEVTVDRGGIPASTAASTATLSITARDTQATLDRLIVTVNDTPFDGRVAGLDVRAAQSKTLARKVEVPILSGTNRIQVSVLNAQGVESLRETVEVRGEMPAVPGKLYALTVGVSQYKTASYNLRYAAKDAADVGALFSKAPHFASAQISAVLDGQATREGILEAKKALLAAGPNDEVLVFLAGHGLLDEQLDYYFATADIDFEHPATRGLSYGDLEGLLDGVRARRKILLMDTCNSGELDKGEFEVGAAPVVLAKADPRVQVRAVGTRGIKKKQALGQNDLSALLGDLFADTRRGSGAVAISSAGGAEFALESDEWKNGVFTFALLEGLKSGAADKDKDGTVTASELRERVQTRVRELTQGRQSPTSRRENLAVDFAVY